MVLVLEKGGMEEMRESEVERRFVKAVKDAGGVAYKLNSLTANGLPDRMVLFFQGKTVFVELKAPGKQMRPLQVKRRRQLQEMGFPVFCIDKTEQIQPAIEAILDWNPGEPFPEGIGARIPELKAEALPDDIPGDMESDYTAGCRCYECSVGLTNGCGHAYGRHYDVWGEGLDTPDYCPQKPDPNDPDALPW